jgi:hypothetical protein
MTAFTNTGRSEALELAKFNVSEQPEADKENPATEAGFMDRFRALN